MIWAILILAAVLRLIALDQSFWLDEAINVLAAKNLTWFEYVANYPIGDFHPPGYFALLWPWTRIFGFSEVAVRIPSVLLGVATVWVTYLLGRRLFDKKVAVLSALFLAIGPLHVFYSQEARMYSLAALAVALSFYFLVGVLEKKKWFYLGFILSTVALLYTDYVAYFAIPAQLIFVALHKRENLKNFLILLVGTFLLLLPWLPVFKEQFLVGDKTAVSFPGWKEVVGGASLKNLGLVFIKTVVGRVSIDNKLLYAVFGAVVGSVYGAVLFSGLRKLDNATRLLLYWIIIPLGLAFVISFFVPVLSYFRFLFILSPFYLLLANGILKLPSFFVRPTIIGIVLISVFSLRMYYLNPAFQRENWRGTVGFIESKADNKTVILFESNALVSPYVLYSRGSTNAVAGLTKIPAGSREDVQNLEITLKNKPVVFLFEYLVEITDPGRFLEKELISNGFKKSEVYNFTGVGFVTLYRHL